MAQMFIASAIASSTRLTTNSAVSRMLRTVSLGAPLWRCSTPSVTTAGSWLSTLKKLKGAALTIPSRSTVVTSAIGRGTTAPISNL